MSWSLQIANGDLAFNGVDMTTVTGSEKLIQDLACWVLEPMGTDTLHSEYGSTLSGGTHPDGTFDPGVIGTRNDALAAISVDAEIGRICLQYQRQQQARYTDDVATYGKSTLTAGEALLAVEGVVSTIAQDHLLVRANLQTGAGDLPLNVPVSSS